jgi:hypothetical protein
VSPLAGVTLAGRKHAPRPSRRRRSAFSAVCASPGEGSQSMPRRRHQMLTSSFEFLLMHRRHATGRCSCAADARVQWTSKEACRGRWFEEHGPGRLTQGWMAESAGKTPDVVRALACTEAAQTPRVCRAATAGADLASGRKPIRDRWQIGASPPDDAPCLFIVQASSAGICDGTCSTAAASRTWVRSVTRAQ